MLSIGEPTLVNAHNYSDCYTAANTAKCQSLAQSHDVLRNSTLKIIRTKSCHCALLVLQPHSRLYPGCCTIHRDQRRNLEAKKPHNCPMTVIGGFWDLRLEHTTGPRWFQGQALVHDEQ